MTRKDYYVAIAEAIRQGIAEEGLDDISFGVRTLAGNIADVMQADNPRFDRQRFLKACGVAP